MNTSKPLLAALCIVFVASICAAQNSQIEKFEQDRIAKFLEEPDHIVDLDGDVHGDITLPEAASPNISPDGKEMVYFDPTRGRGDLWLIGIDGKNARPLLE